ncbi:MAG: AGE family epimerase/isomerase [Pseudobutyrivibrio sp.]|nr:AGE family epimerase/isomerase [Pseudobutyrivibrio sp.]
MGKNYDVVALGELLIDFTENGKSGQGNPLFEANPGGAPCNVLAMLERLGKKTAFMGKVGNDMFGRMLKEALEETKISTIGLKMDEDVHTTLAFVHTMADGDRDFSFYRNPGADMMYSKEDLDDELLSGCKIFHIGSLSMTAEGCELATKTAIERAKAAGALISFDPNLREPLWDSLDRAKEKISYGLTQCDILKISDNEVTWFTGVDDIERAAEIIREKYNPKLMVVTLGKEGSIAYYKDIKSKFGIYKMSNTIETTGAGDTFCACMLYSVLETGLDNMTGESIKQMQKLAAAASALITTRKGALRVMPTREEVDRLMKKYEYGIEENKEFLRELQEDLLKFGHRFPSPEGPSYYLGDGGEPWTDRPRHTWITCRMCHVYSLGHFLGHEGSDHLIDAAIKGIRGCLKDNKNGGWYPGINPDGSYLSEKQCYAHAFVILAACSALKAGRPGAKELLEDALATYDKFFWNEEEGLACDTWNTEFTVCDSYRGVNANMHTVEAFLAVADVCGDEKYRQRAGRIIAHVIEWAKNNNWRIPEHFDDKWNPMLEFNVDKKDDQFKPYGATPGHGIEWARLISQWALSTYQGQDERKPFIEAAENLYGRAITDGWNSDGAEGIVYTTDWSGKPVIHDRMHWTLAEAINSSSFLYRITGDEKYAKDYASFMKYLDEYVLDHKLGSWFHQLDEKNQLIGTVWPGKSDIYHALQSVLIPYANMDESIVCGVAK